MKVVLHLGFIFLTKAVHGKKMERCEFVKRIHQLHVDKLHDFFLISWVCLVEALSNLNTTATHYSPKDQSTDYGIFQINSRYWCDDGKTPNSLNRCGVNCSELLEDDLVKAVNCAVKVGGLLACPLLRSCSIHSGHQRGLKEKMLRLHCPHSSHTQSS
ncbi:lysozyme C-like [Vombatus ursinus]|uniref:lysozyme C-like n=1 Tax=Vombatus ursinus TaxID=29139 RepID=UPI000FFD235E|nr:lysozyme C-like [Vombatus ursinus]